MTIMIEPSVAEMFGSFDLAFTSKLFWLQNIFEFQKNRVQKQFDKIKIWQKPRTLRKCTSKNNFCPKKFEAPSCKLEFARFSVQLEINDGAECDNNVYKMIWTNVTRTNIAWTSVPNILQHLIFVNLGCIPNFSFLGYVEVGKKEVLRVGGWGVLGRE